MSALSATIPNLDAVKEELIAVGRHMASCQFHAALAGNLTVVIRRTDRLD